MPVGNGNRNKRNTRMYIKVFAHGKGRGELATNYLVREDYHNREEEPPEILRGDPDLTAELINSIDRKWKYTAGVLSWHPEDKVTPEKEIELMNDFEKLAFAGLEHDQYNTLWVRHTHANHHELHFVIPRMELSTGKAFNPCPPSWQKHFDPLRDLYNVKEGWARPDDPDRKRLFTPPQADIKYNRLKRWGAKITKNESDEIRELLIEYTLKRIESRAITNREEIIQSFEELGLQINRKGKDYITIHNTESNQKIRLKGGIFNEDWRLRTEDASEITRRQQENGASHTSELERLRSELEAIHAKRSEYNRKRYKKDTAPLTNILENTSKKLFDIPYFRDSDEFRNIPRKQRTMPIPSSSNHELANRIDVPFTRERETIGSTAISQNIRDTSPHGKEREISYSSPWGNSQNRLESEQTRGNQDRISNASNNKTDENFIHNKEHIEKSTNKEQAHERNTKILTGNIQQDRKEFQQQNRYPIQDNQELASPNERIAKATTQLGRILERFNNILQQITQLIPSHTRKTEQIRSNSTRTFELKKAKDRGMEL